MIDNFEIELEDIEEIEVPPRWLMGGLPWNQN